MTDANDIKTQSALPINLIAVMICSFNKKGLFFATNKFPSFPESITSSGFNLYNYEFLVVDSNQVDLLFTEAPVLLEELITQA